MPGSGFCGRAWQRLLCGEKRESSTRNELVTGNIVSHVDGVVLWDHGLLVSPACCRRLRPRGRGSFFRIALRAENPFRNRRQGVPMVFLAGGPDQGCDALKYTHRVLRGSGQLVFRVVS